MAIAGFGSRLRELRRKAGLTQWQIAEQTGVSNTYISALESGRKPAPPHAVVTALSACLGVNEKTLWDLAQREREQRLRMRINGVPTSQRTRQAGPIRSSEFSPEPTDETGLDQALHSLKVSITDPAQRRSLAKALETLSKNLRGAD